MTLNMTHVSTIKWGTIISLVVLVIMCAAGPAMAMMPLADGQQCTGEECQAALRCPEALPSTTSAPVPVRADLPAGLLFAVGEVPQPDGISVFAESDAAPPAYRSSAPLASRSPPSLL